MHQLIISKKPKNAKKQIEADDHCCYLSLSESDELEQLVSSKKPEKRVNPSAWQPPQVAKRIYIKRE